MKYYLLAFLILGWSPGLKLSQSARFPNFQLSEGDHITCVPIREQLSLHSLPDPSYQEPKVLFKPSFELKNISRSRGDHDHPEIKLAGQLFNTEAARSCPEGTIPVRPSRGNLTRKYGTAYNRGIDSVVVGGFGGAGASFNIWQPSVEVTTEFSLSQLWITAGSYVNNDLNTIEVGWQVYEAKYGDKLPHIFIYWTRDAYATTGCYNLDCPGFIQTNSNFVIGGAWGPASVTNGFQRELKVLVYLDAQNGVWWLELNDQTVGYWPTTIFTRLKAGADNIDWGGEIINLNKQTDDRHTKTDMGSGAFASEGFGKAAYIRLMQTVDLANTLHDAPNDISDGPEMTEPGCYTAQKGLTDTNHDWGTYIFFGGPGYSKTSCPT